MRKNIRIKGDWQFLRLQTVLYRHWLVSLLHAARNKLPWLPVTVHYFIKYFSDNQVNCETLSWPNISPFITPCYNTFIKTCSLQSDCISKLTLAWEEKPSWVSPDLMFCQSSFQSAGIWECSLSSCQILSLPTGSMKRAPTWAKRWVLAKVGLGHHPLND